MSKYNMLATKVGGIKMILDEVLDEVYGQFDSEDMTDSFVEGFLYAMELQNTGNKLRDMNELAETLSEISSDYITAKLKKADEKIKWHGKQAYRGDSMSLRSDDPKSDQAKMGDEKRKMHTAAARKLKIQSQRIMSKLVKRQNQNKS